MLIKLAAKKPFWFFMLIVVGTEVLISTQAAQITKNLKQMRLTQFWIRQTKEKQSTKGKKQWPIYKQRKKGGKDGVTCQLLICNIFFLCAYIISFDDSYD